MYAVEFETQITNGHIVVPTEFRPELHGYVRVIVLLDQKPEFAPLLKSTATNGVADSVAAAAMEDDFLTYRMKHPYEIPDFKPLTREQIHERRPDSE